MTNPLSRDLRKLKGHAFHMADWAEDALCRYHTVFPTLSAESAKIISPLYHWVFVPYSLWPFNILDVLGECLILLERGKHLSPGLRLLMDLLPEPPDKKVCKEIAAYEHDIQRGTYENLLKTPAKYAQNEIPISNAPGLRCQWERIKTTFDVGQYRDHKGVIRRSMDVERNLRPTFSVNLHRRDDVFRATFDAFCLRWNLYGMQNDKPLLLKLAVNLTPYGTMIHIPAYWSFDPKRDIRWDAIAKLHRTRVPGRQGSALAEGLAQRMKDAEKLRRLDKEVLRRRLKGEKKHEFLCTGLGWVPGTSPKRLARLRAEFRPR